MPGLLHITLPLHAFVVVVGVVAVALVVVVVVEAVGVAEVIKGCWYTFLTYTDVLNKSL